MQKNLRGCLIVAVFATLALGFTLPRPLWAQGTLENPQPGSFQSGIGIVSGWKCTAGTITVTFDSGAPIQAAYGTSREDTRSVCGDANNGFGLLINWNLLGDGEHIVRALADGVEFGSATFTVTTLGTEFLSGVSGSCTITSFPQSGVNVVVRWQESSQNFVIERVEGSLTEGEICTTKSATVIEFDNDSATFTVTNPCTTAGDTLNIIIETSSQNDSTFNACYLSLDFVQNMTQFDSIDYEWFDPTASELEQAFGFCQNLLPGVRVDTVLEAEPGVPLNFNFPFSIFYLDEKILNFP